MTRSPLFGIAKLLQPDPGIPERPADEHRALTPAYAAPEQLSGATVTTATDVYALGLVLYELLVGRRPFEESSRSSVETRRRITTADPPAPSEALHALAASDCQGALDIARARRSTPERLAKRLRGDLDRIVLRALRREPEGRYASAGHLAEDIQRFLAGHPVSAQPDSVGYRIRRFVGRNRLVVGAAAAVVLLLGASSLLTARQARRIAAERDRAQIETAKAAQVVRLLVDLFETANPEVVPGGDRLAIGEFLERAETRTLRELEGQPELASRMRHVLGLIYGARSDNARARDLLGSALEQRRLLSGADAVETLAIQVDLGRLLVWVADGRARPLLDDALTRVERAHGADHPLAASASHAIAELIEGLDEKQRYLERAVATARRQLPSTDSDRIRYITSLAALYARKGRLTDARALFEEAQRNAEGLNGGRTAIFIGVLNDFATFDTAAGDFTAAEAKHRRALALAEDLIGPDSFQVANALNNLAVALANQGASARRPTRSVTAIRVMWRSSAVSIRARSTPCATWGWPCS